ncbi:MAG: alpha/beta hydrolase [Rhodocyclaceae bacterium]
MKKVSVNGVDVEYSRLVSAHPIEDAPTMVFLHEGLGCVAMWRDFPQRVADATGCAALVYSRIGYGGSGPFRAPRKPDYLHLEAVRELPALLRELGVGKSILFGHSDGGSIALLSAALTDLDPVAVVAMAPHVLVEDVTVAGVRETKAQYQRSDMAGKLGRYHLSPDVVFRAWTDIWLSPAFRDWNIEEVLPEIRCPVLAIQGEDDEYATMAQIELIASGAPDVELCKLADCRHSPHKDQPDAVIDAVQGFVGRVLG